MAKITFRISDDGTVDIDVSCVQGASCEDITRAFSEALGKPTESNLKPEYYQQLSQEFVEAVEGD